MYDCMYIIMYSYISINIVTCSSIDNTCYVTVVCIVIGTLMITVAPKSQTFVEFSNVSYICTAFGYPRPVIEWLKDDTILKNSSSGVGAVAETNYKLLIINSYLEDCVLSECGLKSTLWIFKTTADDVGKYTCNASNIAGYITRTAQLSIGKVTTTFSCFCKQYYYLA